MSPCGARATAIVAIKAVHAHGARLLIRRMRRPVWIGCENETS